NQAEQEQDHGDNSLPEAPRPSACSGACPGSIAKASSASQSVKKPARPFTTRAARRDGGVAEGARLESVYTGNRIVGSNPTPSASASTNLKASGETQRSIPQQDKLR